MTVDIARWSFEKAKISANRDTLNELVCIMSMAVEGYRAHGLDAMADKCDEMSRKIFEQLEASGYYKEV